MQKKNKFTLVVGNRYIFLATIGLVVFGSLMIFSAEMGNAAGDTLFLQSKMIKQGLFAFAGIVIFIIASKIKTYRFSRLFFWAIYAVILGMLLITRLFGVTNGAYAWIKLGSISLQPSEFAKVFLIAFGAKLLSEDKGEKNLENFKFYALHAIIYFLVILVWQSDLGSAVALFIIAYCVALIPSYKEYRLIHAIMIIGIILAVIGMLFLMSPMVTEFFTRFEDDYRIARFLAAANPFKYPYDYGYHLIMSLSAFATGGLFGLGYGNSIHKYMNFPNPSSDFILSVIVEEFGIVGFSAFIVVYFGLLFVIAYYSIKTKSNYSKLILIGTFIYIVVHFILNVGGVSGLIPLTGVPLLLISTGGSSLLSTLTAIGMSQQEIDRYKDESNSGQV